MSDDRLIRLEERLAEALRQTEELSEIVHGQREEIAHLTRRVEMLMMREAEREAAETQTIPLADQKPPHW